MADDTPRKRQLKERIEQLEAELRRRKTTPPVPKPRGRPPLGGFQWDGWGADGLGEAAGCWVDENGERLERWVDVVEKRVAMGFHGPRTIGVTRGEVKGRDCRAAAAAARSAEAAEVRPHTQHAPARSPAHHACPRAQTTARWQERCVDVARDGTTLYDDNLNEIEVNEHTMIGLRFYGAACARYIEVCGTMQDHSAPREEYERAVEALQAQDKTKRGVRTSARAAYARSRSISHDLARSRSHARSIRTTGTSGPTTSIRCTSRTGSSPRCTTRGATASDSTRC